MLFSDWRIARGTPRCYQPPPASAVPSGEAVAQLDHLPLAFGQGGEALRTLLLQVFARLFEGLGDGVVSDEIAQLGVCPRRRPVFQRDRQLRDTRSTALRPAASAAPRRFRRLRLAAEPLYPTGARGATRFSFSTMCTGMRIVRALSAIALVTACGSTRSRSGDL